MIVCCTHRLSFIIVSFRSRFVSCSVPFHFFCVRQSKAPYFTTTLHNPIDCRIVNPATQNTHTHCCRLPSARKNTPTLWYTRPRAHIIMLMTSRCPTSLEALGLAVLVEVLFGQRIAPVLWWMNGEHHVQCVALAITDNKINVYPCVRTCSVWRMTGETWKSSNCRPWRAIMLQSWLRKRLHSTNQIIQPGVNARFWSVASFHRPFQPSRMSHSHARKAAWQGKARHAGTHPLGPMSALAREIWRASSSERRPVQKRQYPVCI